MECEMVNYEDDISLFYYKSYQQPLLRPNAKERNRYPFIMNSPKKSRFAYFVFKRDDILENPISPIFSNRKIFRNWININISNYENITWKTCIRDDLWKDHR